MSSVKEKTIAFHGTFKGGIVVFDDPVTLPEGASVMIILSEHESMTGIQDEFAHWDKAGSEAWKLIAQWEAEEGNDPETLA